jgi:hypothetical protein
MKLKSITPTLSGAPASVPVAVMMASASPAVARAFFQSLLVFRKPERVGRAQLRLGFLGGPLVEKDRDVVTGTYTAVIVAVRADIQIANELLAKVSMPARLALLPRVGRDLELLRARGARLFLLLPPCHPEM